VTDDPAMARASRGEHRWMKERMAGPLGQKVVS
jgi:hypothetical protein